MKRYDMEYHDNDEFDMIERPAGEYVKWADVYAELQDITHDLVWLDRVKERIIDTLKNIEGTGE